MKYEELIKELDLGKLPRHIAVIMDGNGRWAKKRGATRLLGHKNGVKSVRSIVEACVDLKIEYLTIYAFSTENWSRPEDEVKGLFKLILNSLLDELEDLGKKNIKVRFIGTDLGLNEEYRNRLITESQKTWDNTGLNFNIAFNYGGRFEVTEAVRQVAQLVKEGKVNPEEISSEMIESYLYTAGMPDPDLVIRTSGEIRLSNFLIWQTAYSELYFTDILWPDFRKDGFVQAILDYQNRQRRFGGI